MFKDEHSRASFYGWIVAVVAAIAFVAVAIGAFSIGLSAGQKMNSHEYRLLLEDQDAEIILESVNDVVNRIESENVENVEKKQNQ